MATTKTNRKNGLFMSRCIHDHPGSKPYVCGLCQQRFQFVMNLEKHVLFWHNSEVAGTTRLTIDATRWAKESLDAGVISDSFKHENKVLASEDTQKSEDTIDSVAVHGDNSLSESQEEPVSLHQDVESPVRSIPENNVSTITDSEEKQPAKRPRKKKTRRFNKQYLADTGAESDSEDVDEYLECLDAETMGSGKTDAENILLQKLENATTADTVKTCRPGIQTRSKTGRKRRAKQYKCLICNLVHECHEKAAQHVRTNHQSLNCDICTMHFKTLSSLQHHKKDCKPFRQQQTDTKSTDKNVSQNTMCDKCGRSFKSLGGLAIHQRTMENCAEAGDRFNCTMCSYKAGERSRLQMHVDQVHSDARPFSCEVPGCNKTFKTKYNLTHHVKYRHGRAEKKHKCDICGSMWYNLSSLKIHRKHHAAEKNFECGHCQKRFSTNSILTQHVTAAHGNTVYACAVCQFNTVYRNSMKRHMRIVHKIMEATFITDPTDAQTEQILEQQTCTYSLEQLIDVSAAKEGQ